MPAYNLEEPMAQVWLNKPAEVLSWAVAFMEAGLRFPFAFAADDIANEARDVSPAVPGIATRSLEDSNLIEWRGEFRVSKAKSTHGRPIRIWRVKNFTAAENFVARHKPGHEKRQMEML